MSSFAASTPANSILAPDLTKALQVTVFSNHTADRIDELQKFLLASDWSSLPQLDLSASPTRTVDPSIMSDAPIFATALDTAKSAPQLASSTSDSDPCLTPPLRSPFEVCYTDSAGSPDSSRDFLTSPSLFNNVDFDFDSDNPASNFPLFNDHSFETEMSRAGSEPGVFYADQSQALGLENVTLDDIASQATEMPTYASQSTIAASQSKMEDTDFGFPAVSSLDAAFAYAPEPIHAGTTPADLEPFFVDENLDTTVGSTLAMAFGQPEATVKNEVDVHEPVVDDKNIEEVVTETDNVTSRVGPMRSSKMIRQRRASPAKTPSRDSTTSISPAPHAHPTDKNKKWQCSSCGKWFDRAYNLKTHLFTHENPESREKPYECPDSECRKPFARKHDMKRHFDNVHRGESRRPRGISRNDDADDLG